jgi:hypothetical protein
VRPKKALIIGLKFTPGASLGRFHPGETNGSLPGSKKPA